MATNRILDDGRIVRDPAVLGGKPVIRGTRIPVAVILGHLAGNLDVDDLFAAYPRLTADDVRAALVLAHDVVEAHSREVRSAATPVEA